MSLHHAHLSCFLVLAVRAAVPPFVLEDSRAVLAGAATSCTADGHGGSFHHTGGALDDNVMTFAEYHFDPEEDGCYLIEEYHPAPSGDCGGFAPQSIPLRINFCRGLTTFGYIDQSANAGTWNKLISLPFYKGHNASIHITREGTTGAMTACHPGMCFWMADAFRLTYLAYDCRDPVVREAMEQDNHVETTTLEDSANQAVQLDSVTNAVTTTAFPSTTSTTAEETIAETIVEAIAEVIEANSETEGVSEAAQPRMVVEAVLGDAVSVDGHAVFTFQPPLDGCYIVEELHPHVTAVDSAPLKVNYCKGMTAVGKIDHTDGRHDRWNYVASLPFYAGEEGSMVYPESLVFPNSIANAQTTHRAHSFRLTHVGSRCRTPEASVQHMSLRITADFAHVSNRLAGFGQELVQVVADAAGVMGERLYVNHLRPGSIVADITVRPAAALHGFAEAVGRDTSASVAGKITDSLTSTDLATKICDLVDPTIQSCGVKVTTSIAQPQVETVEPQGHGGPGQEVVVLSKVTNDVFGGCMGTIIGVVAGSVLAMMGLIVFCVCRRRKAVPQERTDDKLGGDEEKGQCDGNAQKDQPTVTDAPDVEDVKVADITCEIEKDGHSDDASTVTPVDLRDEGAVEIPGDGDSGNGSQGLDVEDVHADIDVSRDDVEDDVEDDVVRSKTM